MDDDHDAIVRCEEELRVAQLAGDVATLDRLIDDGLVFTALDGTVVGKEEDLALHRSRRLVVKRMEPGERACPGWTTGGGPVGTGPDEVAE